MRDELIPLAQAAIQEPSVAVCVIAFAAIFVAGMAVYAAIMAIKSKNKA